jgi:glycosyltransferase involved in cell wall biosynthesis
MISIAIPTYEMNGVGHFFIEQSLTFIAKQTYKNFEIIISDHSLDKKIDEICVKFDNLNIKLIKNELNRGSSSSNLNNAIKYCNGEIIKFLMQDEYLYNENTLLDIKNVFDNKNINWVVTGCLYGNSIDNVKGKMIPHYSNDIINTINTIGSPSVVSIRKTEDLEFFNPDLIWVMDCEYYKRLFDKWGQPFIIPEYKIFVTQHENQLTNIISSEKKNIEELYLKNKYKN